MTALSRRPRSRVRRTALVGAALSTVALLVQASPASSTVVIPDWPSAGYAPANCATVTPGGSPVAFTFTDTSNPTVEDVDINGTDRVVTLPNVALPVAFRAHLSETCSGIRGAALVIAGTGIATFLEQSADFTSTDVWHPTVVYAGHAVPSSAGFYRVSAVEAVRRYDSFVLSFPDYRLVSKTDTASGAVVVTGSWALKTLYILRGTKIAAGLSRTSVRKGLAVTASASLVYADNLAWKNDNGEKIAVQTKVGTRGYKTVATLTTSSKGKVSYTFTPGSTTYVRFVHTETHTGRFTAGATSAAFKVTVS